MDEVAWNPSGGYNRESVGKLVSLFVHQTEQRIDDLGIKQGAAMVDNFLECSFGSQGSPVGTMRGHRLQNVCHGKYACFGKNLLALQVVWIAAAIHAFMMLEDDFRNRLGKLHILQNLISMFDMEFDYFIFNRCQPPRFGEYLGGDRYLADIMDQPDTGDFLEECWC
jgi:hypothetical protein